MPFGLLICWFYGSGLPDPLPLNITPPKTPLNQWGGSYKQNPPKIPQALAESGTGLIVEKFCAWPQRPINLWAVLGHKIRRPKPPYLYNYILYKDCFN